MNWIDENSIWFYFLRKFFKFIFKKPIRNTSKSFLNSPHLPTQNFLAGDSYGGQRERRKCINIHPVCSRSVSFLHWRENENSIWPQKQIKLFGNEIDYLLPLLKKAKFWRWTNIMSSGSRGNAWRGGRRGYNFRGSKARGGGRPNLRGGRYGKLKTTVGSALGLTNYYNLTLK